MQPNDHDSGSTTLKVLSVLAYLIIIIAGMRMAQPIVVPFILSIFLAVIFAPPYIWLNSKGIPTSISLSLILIASVFIFLMVGALIGTSLAGFSEDLPLYQQRLQMIFDDIINWLSRFGIRISNELVFEYFNPAVAMQVVASTLTELGGVLTNAFLIILAVVFILLEITSYPAKIKAIFGSSEDSFQQFKKILVNVRHYLAIKTVISLATGAIIAVWLLILGVDYALLWGLVAFLLNYIPNLGSIIAAFPAVLLALVQLGVGQALAVAGGFLLVNVFMGNILEPRVMGKGLGLSTLVVFLSLVFWGWILGPVGMLLSVPLTMALKVGLEEQPTTKWLSIVLGSEAAALQACDEINSINQDKI
ncbi:MAG TPA: hypothetical protein DCZ03_06920 [Gammaproteobacteria bacterium]|nr:hypothetical protein [Gammaproteobacteria bacterium]